MVKFLGTDIPGATNQPLQGEVVSPPAPTTQFGQQLANSDLQSVAQAQRVNYDLVNKSYTNVSATQQSQALSQGISQSTGSGFADLAKVATEIYGVYQRQQSLERDKQRVALEKEAEELITKAPEILTGGGGYPMYRQMRDDLLTRYGAVAGTKLDKDGKEIPAGDQIIELAKRLENPAQSYAVKKADRLVEEGYKLRANVIEAQTNNLLIDLQTDFAKIANTTDPSTRAQMWVSAQTNLAERLAGQPEDVKIQIIRTVSAEALKVAKEGEANAATYLRSLSQTSNAISQVSLLQDEFNRSDRGSDALREYQNRLVIIRAQNPYAVGIDGYSDPLRYEREISSYRQTQMSLYRSSQEGLISPADAVKISDNEAVRIAYSLSPADAAQLQAAYGKDGSGKPSPMLTKILTYHDMIKNSKSKSLALSTDISQLTQAQTSITQGSLREQYDWLKWMLTASKEDEKNSALLGAVATINSGAVAEIKKMFEMNKIDVNNPDLVKLRGLIVGASDQIRGQLSQQIDIKKREYNLLFDGLPRDFLKVSPTGVIEFNEEAFKGSQEFTRQYLTNLSEIRQKQMQVQPNGTRPGFSAPQLKEATIEGRQLVMPFLPNAEVTITSHWSRDRNGRPHMGIDFAVPEGTPTVAMVSGKVVTVETQYGSDGQMSGYGKYITIQGDDGLFYRYGHLSRQDVKVGQIVPAGFKLGLTGSTGGSTGPHLHFEILKRNGYQDIDQTINPFDYLSQYKSNYRQARSDNQGPRPDKAVPMVGGSFIMNNQVVTPVGTIGPNGYSYANPFRQGYASDNKRDYGKNDGSANFGYAVIAQDRDFRLALHRVSSKLGIPAQWLADVIAHETDGTFDPQILNEAGHVGLIQFGEAALKDAGVSRHDAANMSRTQQLELVYQYLKPVKSKLLTPTHLGAAIYMGKSGLSEWMSDPKAGQVRYGGVSLEDYMNLLGRHAGRQYKHPYRDRAVIHMKYRASCATCQNLVASGSSIIPHEASMA